MTPTTKYALLGVAGVAVLGVVALVMTSKPKEVSFKPTGSPTGPVPQALVQNRSFRKNRNPRKRRRAKGAKKAAARHFKYGSYISGVTGWRAPGYYLTHGDRGPGVLYAGERATRQDGRVRAPYWGKSKFRRSSLAGL